MDPAYTFHHLPQNPNESLTRRFAALFREATRAIFLDEELILQAHYLLATPSALHTIIGGHWVICIAPNAISGAATLDEGQWVGIYGVKGPLQDGCSGLFEEEGTPISKESLWHARRMYMQVQHRNQQAIGGILEAAEAYIKERHQAASFESGHARVRFLAKDGSASSALYLANAGRSTVVRPISYEELLRGDGSIAGVPPAFVQATPASVFEVPWKLFETTVEC